MSMELALLGQIAVKASIATLFAALGETMAERSGVLNLGVEGMLLVGCLAGFAVGAATGDAQAGMLAAALAGGALAAVHAGFAVTLGANQLLSGLALTLLGQGLSSVLGRAYLGRSGPRITALPVPYLSDLPLLGKMIFSQAWPAYLAFGLALLLWFTLRCTRLGLWTRAAGEDAEAADAAGIPVLRLRWLWTIFGGLCAGLGGGYLSLVYTPGWKESMSGGQGWIALALTIFAGWRPLRATGAALLFGVLSAAQFVGQISGESLAPSWALRMAPYALPILALALAGVLGGQRRAGAPAALGVPFSRP